MRPPGSPKSLERRRRRAIALLERGLSMKEVALRVGVSASSVCRWRQTMAAGGTKALGARPVPGRPRKLAQAECGRLLRLLGKGAKGYAYPDDCWTLNRVAELIRREFSVQYHPRHVWRLLRRCGWAGR